MAVDCPEGATDVYYGDLAQAPERLSEYNSSFKTRCVGTATRRMVCTGSFDRPATCESLFAS